MILTDEEMDREYCLVDLHKDKFAHHAIAKAQLKKIVEWGEETCPHDLGEGTQCYKHACGMCWQALKAGL